MITADTGDRHGSRWHARSTVDRVVATNDRGREITLTLSPPIAQFGLRFAAPRYLWVKRHGARIERDGVVLESTRQWVAPPRPGLGTAWEPET